MLLLFVHFLLDRLVRFLSAAVFSSPRCDMIMGISGNSWLLCKSGIRGDVLKRVHVHFEDAKTKYKYVNYGTNAT